MNNKTKSAIVLCCYGSTRAVEKYDSLKNSIQKRFENSDVYLCFSSKRALRAMNKNRIQSFSLAQSLSDLEYKGYQKIIVSSVYLFPTYEHHNLIKTVDAFKSFCDADICYSDSVFENSADVESTILNLQKKARKKDEFLLYILHGTSKLSYGGDNAVSYFREFCRYQDQKSEVISLEGMFAYPNIKDTLRDKLSGFKNTVIVPVFLINGFHVSKDIAQIKEELNAKNNVTIYDRVLLDQDFITDIISNNIKKKIK